MDSLGRAPPAFPQAVLAAAVLLGDAALAQVFSPGELSRPHAALEGLQSCSKCHPAGEQLSAANCLECHAELRSRLASGKGLHGRLPAEQKEGCWSCHREHRGKDSPLIPWGSGGPKKFDHARTGWPLRGEHAKAGCEKCHERRRITEAAVLQMLARSPRRATYLGLPTLCVSCHFDEHRGQVGQLCGGCHGDGAWKSAIGFDHGQDADYPLLGKHRKVPCAQCHPKLTDAAVAPKAFPAPKSPAYLKFAPVPHSGCTACHDDSHAGKFGPRCSQCHSQEGWHAIRDALKERAFHEKTRFVLKGRHLEVLCASCHGPFPGQKLKLKGLAFEKCGDCHPDGHLGQMSPPPAGKLQSCERCHTVEGFRPATFTLEQHDQTRYRLEQAHRVVACNGCHAEEPRLAARLPRAVEQELRRNKRPLLVSYATFDFPKQLERCEVCHADIHAGQLAERAGGCPACHRQSSWAELFFDHERDSRFPLVGKHKEAQCGSCHSPQRIGSLRAVRYKPLPLACGECHPDSHAGQLAPSSGAPTDCGRCHAPSGFKPSKLVHGEPFTSFRLEGKHQKVACEKCHPAVDTGRGVKVTRYKPLPGRCSGCHEDFHRGEMKGFEPAADAGSDEARCEPCHTPEGWRDGKFRHEQAGFPLLGAHRAQRCTSCHPGSFTAPLPRGCAGCHLEPHAQELGARCEGCHDETSWRSRFGADAHRWTNFPLIGRHAALPCEECHGEMRERRFGRSSPDCSGCHLKDYARTTQTPIDHLKLGMDLDCRRCHGGWRFVPARFPAHDLCFEISAGPHAGTACDACHTALPPVGAVGVCGERSTSCTGCHQHECGRSDTSHQDVLGYQCKDRKCYDCHRLSVPR